MNIIWGILIVAGGFMMAWKSEWILNNFGRVAWAEKHLGMEGGTRLFYKLLGIVIILGGLSVMTGLWNDILGGIVKLFIK